MVPRGPPPWPRRTEALLCEAEQSPASPPSVSLRTSSGNPPPKRSFIQVVYERPLTVDLDHRQPLAVALLQLGVTGDVDLRELEVRVRGDCDERLPRPLAQVAARRVVEDDLRRYGYKPRVVVASATRMTASP